MRYNEGATAFGNEVPQQIPSNGGMHLQGSHTQTQCTPKRSHEYTPDMALTFR